MCKSLWGILALGNKLGVKIHQQKETEVIVEGPIGGVEMMKKVLSSNVTNKDEENPVTKDQGISYDLKITASNLATYCSIPKKEIP